MQLPTLYVPAKVSISCSGILCSRSKSLTSSTEKFSIITEGFSAIITRFWEIVELNFFVCPLYTIQNPVISLSYTSCYDLYPGYQMWYDYNCAMSACLLH